MKVLKSLPYFSYWWPYSGKCSFVRKYIFGKARLQYGCFLFSFLKKGRGIPEFMAM